LGVVAVDRSGSFEVPPIRVVAVKHVEKQKYSAFCLSSNELERYRKMLHEKHRQKALRKKDRKKKMKPENFIERISAAFYFQAIIGLIKQTDIIQIDKDFEGWREEMVRNFLRRLFFKVYGGTSLSDPTIEFIPDHCEKGKEHVKEAHAKTQSAKHGGLQDIRACPDLEQWLDYLE
jgi:hypothetical protein